MTSFSSFCFSLSIFRLCRIVVPVDSFQSAEITVLDGVNFLRSLFISLFELIFMSVLLTRILLLYRSFFLMFKFKLLESIYIPTPTEKSTFDNACSSTPWYYLVSIDKAPLIKSLNVSLKTFWASTAGAELPAIVDLALTWELTTR